MSLNNTQTHGKLQKVSDSTKQHADDGGDHADQWPKNLPQHSLAAQRYVKFLLMTQHEVPFINTNEGRKTEIEREMYKCHEL